MRIRQKLDERKPSLSFEFFPPKDDIGFWDLYKTIEALKPIHPTFVSVTYGAGGGTRRKTIDLVQRIKHDIGIEPLAHLTCVGATRQEIGAVVDEFRQQGIENILALRGDPPTGTTAFTATEGGFAHANELISFIRDRCDLCIGAACYPEKHPESPSLDQDMAHVKGKVDAGADFLISQLFFDNQAFYRYREQAERAGITVPIIAGIMPILSVKQVKKFTQMCGATIPVDLLRKIESLEDDAEAVRHVGTYHATQQCHDLIAQGVAGIHFYTLNRSTATRAVYQYIRTML